MVTHPASSLEEYAIRFMLVSIRLRQIIRTSDGVLKRDQIVIVFSSSFYSRAFSALPEERP